MTTQIEKKLGTKKIRAERRKEFLSALFDRSVITSFGELAKAMGINWIKLCLSRFGFQIRFSPKSLRGLRDAHFILNRYAWWTLATPKYHSSWIELLRSTVDESTIVNIDPGSAEYVFSNEQVREFIQRIVFRGNSVVLYHQKGELSFLREDDGLEIGYHNGYTIAVYRRSKTVFEIVMLSGGEDSTVKARALVAYAAIDTDAWDAVASLKSPPNY